MNIRFPFTTMRRFRHAALLCLLAALTGCVAREPVRPGLEPRRFLSEEDGRISRSIGEYVTVDGRRMEYVHHVSRERTRKASVIYIHGLESHAEWFDATAVKLAQRGYEVFSLDRRGSGINGEQRGFAQGDAPSFETWLSDIRACVEQCVPRERPRVLAGLSWGGKLALAYVLAHPEDADALALITPGIVSKVDLPWWKKAGVLLSRWTFPTKHFASPVKIDMFTADPHWQEAIRRDPLRLRSATARFFWETHRMDRWNRRHVVANRSPILLFLAGQDRIVDNDAVVGFLGSGQQEVLAVLRYSDQTHAIQLEMPAQLAGDMDRWLGEMDVGLPQGRKEGGE